jgi:hypothetical protein
MVYPSAGSANASERDYVDIQSMLWKVCNAEQVLTRIIPGLPPLQGKSHVVVIEKGDSKSR